MILQRFVIETDDLEFIKKMLRIAIQDYSERNQKEVDKIVLIAAPESGGSFLPGCLEAGVSKKESFPILTFNIGSYEHSCGHDLSRWCITDSCSVAASQLLDAFDRLIAERKRGWKEGLRKKHPHPDEGTVEVKMGFRIESGGTFHPSDFILSLVWIDIPE